MSDINLKTITFPQIGNKYLLGDPTLSISGTGADAKATGDALATKANTDGSYESMTVGNAEQLVSNVRVNDKTPYLFRTSGGSVDIGDREYINGIVGGTVAWNQKLNKDHYSSTTTVHEITYTNNGDGSITVSGTSDGRSNINIDTIQEIPKGHKWLAYGVPSGAAYSTHYLSILEYNANTYQTSFGVYANGKVFTTGENTTRLTIEIVGAQVASYSPNNLKFVPQLFDLTQMFGSTIADYIYSLEQANAGAGVAWFRKLFPKPYYAYNAGELKSVSGLVSHDMTGFNQLPTTPTYGTETQIKNYVFDKDDCARLIKGQSYEYRFENITNATNWRFIFKFFDTDGNLLGGTEGTDTTTSVGIFSEASATFYWYSSRNAFMTGSDTTTKYVTFTPAVDCYLKPFFAVGNTSASSIMEDACVHLRWDGSRDGEYEEYELHSYPLDSDVVLRGIPKLDTNNKLYYDGDIYEPDGTITRKYGVVTLDGVNKKVGSVGTYAEGTWAYTCSGVLSSPAQDFVIGTVAGISDKCQYAQGDFRTASACYCVTRSAVFVMNTEMTVAQANTWLQSNPITIVYTLATPATETADPHQGVQIVNDFGTEEYVIDSEVSVQIPVGHDTDYPVNLVAKLEMAPNSPYGDGDYIVRQVNGENSYVPLVIEDALPTMPSTAGTYKLTVTVTEGSDPVLAWTQA